MPRIARLIVNGEPAVYHVISRTALDGFVLGDVEKEYLLELIKRFGDAQIPYFRKKWSSLSEYVKEIKQGFSRFYNRSHNRKGFFWSERFKSLIVEDGETLINCLAYIDLHPVKLLEDIRDVLFVCFAERKRVPVHGIY